MTGRQCVHEQFEYFPCYSETIFPIQLLSHWSINMPKVLLFRFEQCLGPFIMMLFKGFSETGLFRYLSNHGFLSPAFRKDISYEGHLYFENFQFFIDISKIQRKSGENVLPWRDNCISIACVKLSFLRTQYFWLTVNALKNSPENLRIIKRDFFELTYLHRDQQIW